MAVRGVGAQHGPPLGLTGGVRGGACTALLVPIEWAGESHRKAICALSRRFNRDPTGEVRKRGATSGLAAKRRAGLWGALLEAPLKGRAINRRCQGGIVS